MYRIFANSICSPEYIQTKRRKAIKDWQRPDLASLKILQLFLVPIQLNLIENVLKNASHKILHNDNVNVSLLVDANMTRD